MPSMVRTYSGPITVTINVGIVNSPPIADADGPYGATEDTLLTVSAANGVLAGDTDADGNPLTAHLLDPTSNGTLTLNPDGSFTYQPASNFSGQDSFTYRAFDGLTYSDPVTVAINVGAVNDAPVADADGPYNATEDTLLTVNAANGVLTGDTDADRNPLTAELVTPAGHGTLTLNSDGSFTYQPASNFSGQDSFTYRAFDGTAYSDPVTVVINVGAVNDTPAADADGPYSASEDTTLTVSAANGVLAGDTDVDGNPLTAAVLGDPTSHGALTLNSDRFVHLSARI